MSTPVEPQEPSLGELFGRVTSDLTSLVRQEIQLAKVEITEEVRTAGKAGGLLGGGAFTGYFALLFLSVALGLGLAELVPAWAAFLIVGVLYGIAAAVLVSKGKQKLDQIDPVPQQTVQTLKEDVEWAKTRSS